jgi:hypothetical protein
MGEAPSECPRTSSQPGSTPTRRRLTNDPESTARRRPLRESPIVMRQRFTSARGASAECPIACRRNQEKNAGETRGQGSLSRWPYLGWGQPVKGARPESDPLFLAPLLALFHPGCLVRERPESGGIGCCLRPTPTLRPHCPLYSSSDSTASGKALTVDPSTEKPCKQGMSSGASRGPHSRSRHSSNSRQSFFLFGAPALSE